MDDSHQLITVLQLIITFLSGIGASSGFWLFLTQKRNNSQNNNRLLMGLAHDRIVYLCMKFIVRGWISQDEYENLNTYLYQPYIEMNGNGITKRLMLDVDKLPIRESRISKIIGDSNATD